VPKLHNLDSFDSFLSTHPNPSSYILQMAREKRGKQRAATLESESPPSSDSEATEEASPVVHHTGKRKAVAKVPLCSRGHGRPNPEGKSRQGTRPRIKCASTLGSHMADVGESLEYLERINLRMSPQLEKLILNTMGLIQ
jgi:hypothetical protein